MCCYWYLSTSLKLWSDSALQHQYIPSWQCPWHSNSSLEIPSCIGKLRDRVGSSPFSTVLPSWDLLPSVLQLVWLGSSCLLCPIIFLKFQDPISRLMWFKLLIYQAVFQDYTCWMEGNKVIDSRKYFILFHFCLPCTSSASPTSPFNKVKLSFVYEPHLSTCEWVLKQFSLFKYHRKYMVFFLNSSFTSLPVERTILGKQLRVE